MNGYEQAYPNELVVCQFLIDGYTLFSLTRASAIVKRQLMVILALLRRVSQTPTSLRTTFVASRRRSRHWRSRMESSVSAMFSQLPWTGVGWISNGCNRFGYEGPIALTPGQAERFGAFPLGDPPEPRQVDGH